MPISSVRKYRSSLTCDQTTRFIFIAVVVPLREVMEWDLFLTGKLSGGATATEIG
jgi:hypothetical protein